MANLSDLDTTQIGIIAFWNAHDHRVVPGVGNVNPTDCIGVFTAYSVYDNGIEGYKTLGSGRYFHARVKTDGWMAAWIDRTNTFAYPNKAASDFGEAANKGYYDVLYDWFVYGSSISSTYTTLSYLISLLYNALTNKASFTFAADSVGHYCYEYPNANVITLCDVYQYNGTQTGKIQYTIGTAIYYAAATGDGHTVAGEVCKVSFAGTYILDFGASLTKYGSMNIKSLMPNPLTDYSLYCQSNSNAHGALLILWA